MQIVAYQYQDLTWETQLEREIWGWEMAQVLVDYQPDRPQLQQWLEQLAPLQPPSQTSSPHCPDYFLLRRLEELGDSLQQLSAHLLALEGLGITVVAIEQDYQSPTFQNGQGIAPQPPTSLQLLALLDSIQMHQRSRLIRHGHARNRLKGKPPPGKAPYGYRRGKERYVIDRGVAPIVKDFFNHFLLYGSLRGAVRHLKTKHGKTIAVSTGKRWLTSPVYRGDLQYQDQGILPDTHPALLSREEAAQVDRLLRRNRSLAPRSASAPRSLAGLAICAVCKSPMTITRVTIRNRQTEYLYLRPTACPEQSKCKALAYQQVLAQTIQQICIQLPLAVASIDTPIMSTLKQNIDAQIKSKEATLAQLSPLVSAQILDQTTADLRTYTIRTEISALRKRLAQLPPVNLQEIAKTVSIDQFWLDLSEPERRFYFREFIRQVEIVRQGQDWRVKLVFMF